MSSNICFEESVLNDLFGVTSDFVSGVISIADKHNLDRNSVLLFSAAALFEVIQGRNFENYMTQETNDNE